MFLLRKHFRQLASRSPRFRERLFPLCQPASNSQGLKYTDVVTGGYATVSVPTLNKTYSYDVSCACGPGRGQPLRDGRQLTQGREFGRKPAQKKIYLSPSLDTTVKGGDNYYPSPGEHCRQVSATPFRPRHPNYFPLPKRFPLPTPAPAPYSAPGYTSPAPRSIYADTSTSTLRVIFLPKNMRPQRRAGREVHRIRYK